MSEQSLQDGMESGSKVTGHDLDKTKEERKKEKTWRRRKKKDGENEREWMIWNEERHPLQM